MSFCSDGELMLAWLKMFWQLIKIFVEFSRILSHSSAFLKFHKRILRILLYPPKFWILRSWISWRNGKSSSTTLGNSFSSLYNEQKTTFFIIFCYIWTCLYFLILNLIYLFSFFFRILGFDLKRWFSTQSQGNTTLKLLQTFRISSPFCKNLH